MSRVIRCPLSVNDFRSGVLARYKIFFKAQEWDEVDNWKDYSIIREERIEYVNFYKQLHTIRWLPEGNVPSELLSPEDLENEFQTKYCPVLVVGNPNYLISYEERWKDKKENIIDKIINWINQKFVNDVEI